jgi:hypothetical protein
MKEKGIAQWERQSSYIIRKDERSKRGAVNVEADEGRNGRDRELHGKRGEERLSLWSDRWERKVLPSTSCAFLSTSTERHMANQGLIVF